MSVGSVLLWGFMGTLVLTVVLAGARGLRFTRMSIPLILGTMLSADWNRAQRYGIGVHLLIGWALSTVYAFIFEDLGLATWWLGALMGLGHGITLLVLGMVALPHFHPRMSPEIEEPSELPMLEPPGFLGSNYGRSTPVVTLLGHVLYGLILGAFYRV